ncbi:DUF4255 domain-containing protein [Roseomonas sp. M0104]|uniref:DUF4255 domain-containing protein n=1 Tax=Teichococcus coralli TaxID=2545983 RepID=A0A845BJ83_9PROT|nr:DUF4255 domain-containing protein [Pseudoroseomonas coralli]MXP65357.1 DUF4255 domain-containing protein [Pseudoroseomonas coralli]
MAVAASSLSVAVQGIADYLDTEFGEDVIISIDTPLRAHERAKDSDKHVLNIFVYRIAPSGFHAGSGAEEPFFVRLHTLITPFPGDKNNPPEDIELRVLGHAIRVLQSNPVLPAVFPGGPAGEGDFRNAPHRDYRLRAILQAPSMEEINHIWTTQGGELAYRVSAAYEFALVPIEPLALHEPAGPVRTAILDVAGSMAGRDQAFVMPGPDSHPIPRAGRSGGAPPTDWLPLQLLAGDAGLTNRRSLPPGTGQAEVALAGPSGEKVAIEVAWTRADASTDTQPPQVFRLSTARIDEPAARVTITLDNPAAGDRARLMTRPADAAGQPLPEAAPANMLEIRVEGA